MGEKTASLATEADQLVVPTVAAEQAQEAVGQDAAIEKGVKLVLDELRQVGAGSVFGLGEEGRSVLLHRAVPRGPLRAVALEVDRGAIRCPLGLPANGLHARLPKWWAGTVSSPALRLNRPQYHLSLIHI